MRNIYSDISGVILAGGQSSRMGLPKAFLTVKGKRIIDIILEVFHPLFEEIFIVTDDKGKFIEFKDVQVIEDLVKGCGPLGGIYTGLKSISKDKAFFIACDMPFLHIGLISRLLETSRKGDYSCVVPYSDKGIEPLYAVYSKGILGELEGTLSKKELSVRQLLQHCNCKYIKSRKEEVSSFFNINTPEELKEIQAYEGKI